MSETVSVRVVASRLGLGINTVYRLIREGRLPVIKAGSRQVRISTAVIDEILAKGSLPEVPEVPAVPEYPRAKIGIGHVIPVGKPKKITPRWAPPGELKPGMAEKVAELWREICVPAGLADIRILTVSRKNKIKQRAKVLADLDAWRDYFEKIARAPFLRGENDRNWRADFDWAIRNDENVDKVLCGRYGDQQEDRNEAFAKEVAKWRQAKESIKR